MDGELESYIMRCAKVYEQKHPNQKVKLYKTEKHDLCGCNYCRNEEPVNGIYIKNDKLIANNSATKIRYCCFCGREL